MAKGSCVVVPLLLAACARARSTEPLPATAASPTPSAVSSAPVPLETKAQAAESRAVAKPVPLPGAKGSVSLDYLTAERGSARIWVPAGGTGNVDIFDVKTGTFTVIGGFATSEREARGKKRVVGPSAVSIGGGFAFIGNRATSEVCPIDLRTLKKAPCYELPAPTDGVEYVASAKEVWVTTPRVQSLAVLDASRPEGLVPKAVVKVDGAPEGYAVDDVRGTFFTNLEDRDVTLAIDVASRRVNATWHPNCGPSGPRGLVFDSARNHLVVACTDHVQVLDAGHDGAPLGALDTGGGVDNLDYLPEKELLYVAAAKAARLTVAHLDAAGRLAVVWTAGTSEGARNAVADAEGNAYVADGPGGRLLVVPNPNAR